MRRSPTFIDAYAGCGGLTLGLMQAGWRGLFAIEKDRFAYDTLETNFLHEGCRYKFEWPNWLPQEPIAIGDLISTYGDKLKQLKGHVDLLAGGPPCQGFSCAGRRHPNDPRNQLVGAYLDLVAHLKPGIVLMENVRGITYDFVAEEGNITNYSWQLIKKLSAEYKVFTRLLTASHYGVPQKRPRFFLIGLRRGLERHWPHPNPFTFLNSQKNVFLTKKGLPDKPTSKSAISDLEVSRNGTVDCVDSNGYQAIGYKAPRTAFQRLMREGFFTDPSDTRLAKHNTHVVERFASIIDMCKSEGRLNTAISKEMREKFGLKKRAIRVLDPRKPAPTITSMPDDLLHYCEPRTLTVRENARLQTFPDWFEFKGKYTTGGELRRREVPRFTQVANAVPPLLAELLGVCLASYQGS